MQQNKNLAGAAEAIERSKNAGGDLADEAQSTFTDATDRAKRALEETSETAQEYASEAYDQVGDAFRASEDFVRRRPLESLALAAIIAFGAGYLFRR